jgi:hypothetical protein
VFNWLNGVLSLNDATNNPSDDLAIAAIGDLAPWPERWKIEDGGQPTLTLICHVIMPVLFCLGIRLGFD